MLGTLRSVAEQGPPQHPPGMQDLATTDISKPNRIDRLTPRVRNAIKLMVWDGKELHEAASEVGLTTRAMRLAIEKPFVIAAIKREKQMLRESVSARNIHRLREIRDAADNMPAIQAIRTLEGMGDDQPTAAGGASASPGITIRIMNVVQSGHAEVCQPVMDTIKAPRTLLAEETSDATGGGKIGR